MLKPHRSNNSGAAFNFAITVAAFIVASTLVASSAQAANTSTGTLTVQANVEASGTVSNATLDFGKIDDLSSATTAKTTFDVTATKSTPYTVSMSAGSNGSGPDTRAMSNGTDQLDYQLYTDQSRNNKWVSNCSQQPSDVGSGGSASDCHYGTGSGNAQTIDVYGKVPAGQNVEPGSDYTDTVVMTVHY